MEKETQAVTAKKKPLTLPELLNMKSVIQKFANVLGKNALSFIASLLSIYNDDEKLRKCDPVSILAAAKQAAILQLPIMKQLGYAYVIPYYDDEAKKYVAQFQMGYKGLLQLAMRSGVYKNVNTLTVFEGLNPFRKNGQKKSKKKQIK